MRDGSQCRNYTGIFYCVFRLHEEATGVSYAKTAVVPSDCEVHVTPSGLQMASTCAYLLTSLSVSSNMCCSKFLAPTLYPDRQTYRRIKARKLSSQVVTAASFVFSL
jgi:hypothetical protein